MTIEVRAISPVLGAEILGVDCSEPLDADTLASVRRTWLEHLVVFFPDQQLSPDTQVAFASQFGAVTAAHPVEPSIDEHTSVLGVDSTKDRVNWWHTDVTYMARPPMASLLYAVTVPDVGGDTMFASTRHAYETLAPPLQGFCDTLTAWHFDPYYAQLVAEGKGKEWADRKVRRLTPVEHPVVRVHPETKRKALFVNPQFTVGLKGFPGRQGPALLQLLYDHCTQWENICRYRWHAGTLGMWDNRATLHYALNDYGTARRIMHRVTLAGGRPYGPVAA